TSPGRRAAGLALHWVVGRLVSVLAWRAAASCLHAISKLLPWATQRAVPTGTGVGTSQRFRGVDDDGRGAAAGAYPACRAGAGHVGFRRAGKGARHTARRREVRHADVRLPGREQHAAGFARDIMREDGHGVSAMPVRPD